MAAIGVTGIGGGFKERVMGRELGGAVLVPLFVDCSALGGVKKRGRFAVAGGARDSAPPGA